MHLIFMFAAFGTTILEPKKVKYSGDEQLVNKSLSNDEKTHLKPNLRPTKSRRNEQKKENEKIRLTKSDRIYTFDTIER